MRPRYCCSADSRMRMQNALLLTAAINKNQKQVNQSQESEVWQINWNWRNQAEACNDIHDDDDDDDDDDDNGLVVRSKKV